tara:strand:+ start:2128 stop:2700 length:573 start_codon:yes stop_codon:yes gene_type:complete
MTNPINTMKTPTITDLIDQQMLLSDYWKTISETHDVRNNRERRNVIYRHAFFAAARSLSSLSLQSLGKILDRDHATVLHACRIHDSNYHYDKTYRSIFDSIANSMSQSIDNHAEGIENRVIERLKKIDVDLYEKSIVDRYIKKMEHLEFMHKQKIDSLKRELRIVGKQLKIHQTRAENLDKECLRLRNLL